jgi:hypothetical protein
MSAKRKRPRPLGVPEQTRLGKRWSLEDDHVGDSPAGQADAMALQTAVLLHHSSGSGLFGSPSSGGDSPLDFLASAAATVLSVEKDAAESLSTGSRRRTSHFGAYGSPATHTPATARPSHSSSSTSLSTLSGDAGLLGVPQSMRSPDLYVCVGGGMM